MRRGEGERGRRLEEGAGLMAQRAESRGRRRRGAEEMGRRGDEEKGGGPDGAASEGQRAESR